MKLHVTKTSTADGHEGAQVGLRTVWNEVAALQELAKSLSYNYFSKAISLVLKTEAGGGRVHILGLGKSAHVGRKLAATLSSTGTPAVFLDPVTALHGDSGQVVGGDLVIAVSHSGETKEVLDALRLLKANGACVLSIVGSVDCPMAALSDSILHVYVAREAGPLGLAPTSSTTCQLVIGDGLAAALMAARGFSEDAFYTYHPGGALGERSRYSGRANGTDLSSG